MSLDKLKTIYKQAEQDLAKLKDLAQLNNKKAHYLGKQGLLKDFLKDISKLSNDEKKVFGKEVNAIKSSLEEKFQDKKVELENKLETVKLASEKIDITLPGKKMPPGSLHPLTIVENEIIDALKSLGFTVATGPEIESDYYNFEALNFPINHPARDMQDTFFVDQKTVLRTHTSPVQVRCMRKSEPPLRIIVPGRVYRNDADSTHSPVFHQVEGLCVDTDIHFGDLKGTLETFIKMIFGSSVKTRFRPSFFPFTEPSAEVDIMGKNGWMEILGCGMVDPNVFNAVIKLRQESSEESSYNPEKISGFAFGLGVERIAMLLYGIDDIRGFYENDTRFIGQFG
ncbi:MAG TPA: phenylalanine--tRNA ligase subunit alpha [Oligoflexia bacterium]|nr:phenylalanine--tRNA ligase subunit alpha [Oligoflexia bacterium]HMR24107.1 phenylalanine--tRNA ligase subunit alpha [Oligoflexia bacterium]